MRWQCLAQARQGQEVEALRKAPQNSMAAPKWRERWQRVGLQPHGWQEQPLQRLEGMNEEMRRGAAGENPL